VRPWRKKKGDDSHLPTLQWVLQGVFVKQVLSHSAVGLGGGEAGQAAHVVSQLLDGVVAVSEEVSLEEVTQMSVAMVTSFAVHLNDEGVE